jgi:hypothetical protein
VTTPDDDQTRSEHGGVSVPPPVVASPARFAVERAALHAGLLDSILTVDERQVASNADRGSSTSRQIALEVARMLNYTVARRRGAGQTAGSTFESLCGNFIRSTFLRLHHLRPGRWDVEQVSQRRRLTIARFDQYAHLIALEAAAQRDPALAAALGSDYTITPDVIVTRQPEPDTVINAHEPLIDDTVSTRAALRADLHPHRIVRPLLHASLSCKWTLRSDRAQNARAEALNLIRNRKGRLPHVAVVTAEPLPSRLASIALGTGDIDCVYHFALYELQNAVEALDLGDTRELLTIMVEGGRLKDISDLPLDIAT